jgi:hypothetical protein
VARVMFTGGVGFDRAGTENFSEPGEPMTVSRAQEAVIAHFDEAVRQHVLEEPTTDLFGCYRTDSDLIRGRVLGLKGNSVIF